VVTAAIPDDGNIQDTWYSGTCFIRQRSKVDGYIPAYISRVCACFKFMPLLTLTNITLQIQSFDFLFVAFCRIQLHMPAKK